MKTSKEITSNIKKGIITKSMVDEALYSANKRAKNHRDNEKYYIRYCHNKYRERNIEREKEEKKKMYGYKEILLSILKPSCIHKEPLYKKVRVNEYHKDYERLLEEQNENIVWQNLYPDYELDALVEFFDYLKKDEIIGYRYYLFYEMPNHTYHSPITEEQLLDYVDLEVKEIGRIVTTGDDIHDLMSVQAVRKIIALIESGDYQYIEE